MPTLATVTQTAPLKPRADPAGTGAACTGMPSVAGIGAADAGA